MCTAGIVGLVKTTKINCDNTTARTETKKTQSKPSVSVRLTLGMELFARVAVTAGWLSL